MPAGGNRDSMDLKQQVAALQMQLREAEKLTALGELVGTTTHEFNNVLMTIINYAKLGLRHKDEATRDKALEKIFAASQRAAKITGSVLGMARNRSGSFQPTDLESLTEDVLILLEREMNKYRVSIDRQFGEVPKAWVDGNQIQQILLNLMTNARQAMPDGGTLTIRLAHDAENGTVDLTIRDTGSGIPPDQLPHIFDRFYSTKRGPDASGKGGTGLGLSACREIVESHRGRLRVDSTVGKGTAITVKLPVAHRETNAEASPQSTPTLGMPQPASTVSKTV